MTDHAIQRAKERFGLDLTVSDIVEISRRCRLRDGAVLVCDGDRRGTSKFLTLWNGIAIYPVRKDNDGSIVTITGGKRDRFVKTFKSHASMRRREPDHRVRKLSPRDVEDYG